MKKALLLSLMAATSISLAAQDLDKYPWLDQSKSFHERAVLLVKELTLREKVDQLGNNVSEPSSAMASLSYPPTNTGTRLFMV
jgi:hypothetical protein